MDVNWPASIAATAIFWLAGIVLSFWPKQVQKYYLGFLDRHQNTARFNPFVDWMRTPSYVMYLRVIGVVCFTVSAFLMVCLAVAIRSSLP
ncbi:MAG TPA: hypothetical protein VLE22_12735 [Bryobacteraceae bacterium]|nr:hypothetical protein [Bryobacteraceae bacterium]